MHKHGIFVQDVSSTQMQTMKRLRQAWGFYILIYEHPISQYKNIDFALL